MKKLLIIEDDRVFIGLADYFARPLRLTPDQALALVTAGASMAPWGRADDDGIADVLAQLDHEPTRRCVEAERAFLATLGSGCSLPVGAFAEIDHEAPSANVRLHTFDGTSDSTG